MTFGPRDRSALTPLPGGGVCAPTGVRAAGGAAGLKPSGRPDLALVVADQLSGAAATTTTNQVKAAPCVVTEEHVAAGQARAVVVNAGSANACTGDVGLDHARATCAEVARLVGCEPGQVLPLSTGIIGVTLPIDTLLSGLPDVHGRLERSDAAASAAAEAICTTDTRTKQVAYEVADDTGSCRVGGMAKGAGMIEPAMATLLGVITTDAPLTGAVLRPMLRQAVARSFNRISVDACGSTNDTIVVLATGTAERPPGLAAVQAGIEAACADLARMVVEDGEGMSRVAEVTVSGARTEDDAAALARAVCASALFRAAVHGADPNWGRVLAALGSSPVRFEPARVEVRFAGTTVCRFGAAASFDRDRLATRLDAPVVPVEVLLGQGDASATMLTADLTPQYVAENAYYTT